MKILKLTRGTLFAVSMSCGMSENKKIMHTLMCILIFTTKVITKNKSNVH